MFKKLSDFVEKHEKLMENMEQALEDDMEQYKDSFDERDIMYDQGYLAASEYLIRGLKAILKEKEAKELPPEPEVITKSVYTKLRY